MKTINEIDNLLARHFSNEALSEQQQKELNNWIKNNEQEYKKLKSLLENTDIPSDIEFETSGAWENVNHQLHNRKHFNMRKFYVTIGYAASLFIIVGSILFWNKRSRIEHYSYVNAGTAKEKIWLPDSSSVILYPKSKIAYNASIEKGPRQITFTGKAFFDVRKNAGRSFIIEAYDVKVEVLGTSFLVEAYTRKEADIYVKNGVVKVETNGKNVILEANEQAEVANGNIIKSEIPDSLNVFDNKPGTLNFDNTPIVEVIRVLENLFDVKIDLGYGLKQNRITTQLKDDNLENILLELSYICNCKYDTISERRYKLYYP